MRNYLIASAAKENGAEFVALVEPDLFYSAQDRGPRTVDHPQVTDFASREKFVGQACSAEMYAQLLKTSGVDSVMTVHNHKPDVMRKIYEKVNPQENSRGIPSFLNLDIAPLIANYILRSGLVRLWNYGEHVGFVAPDDGAAEFVNRVRELSGLHNSVIVTFRKTRHGQRDVTMDLSDDVELLKGRDIFILDDMVRTGGTIAANISAIYESNRSRPANIFFYSTHATISSEARENLNSPYLNQFITSNTIPSVLNRDDQGRLRKKIVVLKIEKWIANAIRHCLEEAQLPDEIYGINSVTQADEFYEVDLSTKNPLHNKSRVQQYELTI
jgi:ribose-phosphate pyrophosphokinase